MEQPGNKDTQRDDDEGQDRTVGCSQLRESFSGKLPEVRDDTYAGKSQHSCCSGCK